MNYTAAQMVDIALDQLRRLPEMADSKMKVCRDCSRKHGEKWTLVAVEARQHKDRYPEHVIVEDDVKPKEVKK